MPARVAKNVAKNAWVCFVHVASYLNEYRTGTTEVLELATRGQMRLNPDLPRR